MSCCPTCGNALPSRAEINLDGLARTLVFRGHVAGPIERQRFEMLTLLVNRLGRIVSKGALYDFLFDARPDCDQPDFKIIDVQLCRLRREVAPTGLNIRTIWGAGVRLEKPDEPVVVTGGALKALARQESAARAPTAREILHAMLEHAHFEGVGRDGAACIALNLPPALFAALTEWEADAPEDDQVDEGAPEQKFYGSGNIA